MTASTQPEPAPELIRSPVTAFVIGLLGGIVTASFGIGGGLLMAPALAWLLRIRPQRANGTSLAVLLPTALAAAVQYHLQAASLHHPVLSAGPIATLTVGSIVGAYLAAARFRGRLGAGGRWAFGLALLVTGALLGGGFFQRPYLPPAPLQHFALLGIGIVSGLTGATAGAGGGLLMIPLLVLGLGFPQHLAQATSLAVLVPASLTGALIHTLRGNVIWSLGRSMLLGALLGAWVMAGSIYEIPESVLRAAFGILVAVIGVTTALRRDARPPEPAPGETEPARENQTE